VVLAHRDRPGDTVSPAVPDPVSLERVRSIRAPAGYFREMEDAYYRLQRVVDLESAGTLRAELLSLVNASQGDVIVDCVQLEFIDSIGVAVFGQIRRLLAVHDRNLQLMNLSPRAHRPFELLGHGDYFEAGSTSHQVDDRS